MWFVFDCVGCVLFVFVVLFAFDVFSVCACLWCPFVVSISVFF